MSCLCWKRNENEKKKTEHSISYNVLMQNSMGKGELSLTFKTTQNQYEIQCEWNESFAEQLYMTMTTPTAFQYIYI